MTNFKNLHLNPKILNALDKKGYTTPTDIQRQAIPDIMAGKDLLGIAQTGTGKTAAFSLPILHNLAKNTVSVKSGGVRVLILTPTRELASQIADNIELYGKELGLRYAVIFGGVSERPQITAVQRGIDILIATPGRLLDLTSQGYIRYMQLEVLVLDEADRMLDMGFINDIKKIIQRIPEKRQTLFFSATMPATIIGLANSILKNPVKVEVTPQSTTVERIDQKVLFVEKSHKLSLLKKLIKDEAITSVLVFCKTKHGANKVEEFLEKNSISVSAIHGNKSQGARERALESFRSGKIKVLVATDIAARGIDIPAISHVINYDIPLDPESYVHRIGRTARAGRNGVAISFCDSSEIKFLREVEKAIKMKIPLDESHPFHGVEAAPMQKILSKPRQHNKDNSNQHRKYGFSVNKERRITESKRNSERRDESKYNGSSEDYFTKKDDSKSKKKIFGLFSFVKKKSESHSRKREDDRRYRDNSSSRSEGIKKESFGFGWFKNKKSDVKKNPHHRSERRSEDNFEDRKKSDYRGGRKFYSGNNRNSRSSNGRNYSGSSKKSW